MSAESTSQNFYRELKKLLPELARIPNVVRVIVDAKVGELPILSVQVESLLVPKGGGRARTHHAGVSDCTG